MRNMEIAHHGRRNGRALHLRHLSLLLVVRNPNSVTIVEVLFVGVNIFCFGCGWCARLGFFRSSSCVSKVSLALPMVKWFLVLRSCWSHKVFWSISVREFVTVCDGRMVLFFLVLVRIGCAFVNVKGLVVLSCNELGFDFWCCIVHLLLMFFESVSDYWRS